MQISGAVVFFVFSALNANMLLDRNRKDSKLFASVDGEA